jgi:RNA polymerase-associated protein RTF1
MSGSRSHSSIILERSRLQQARTLALRRNDREEVRTLDEQLVALDASTPKSRTAVSDVDDISRRLAKVNERNRKANLESVRRAEQAAAERKREERDRKKLASGIATPKNGLGSKYVFRCLMQLRLIV